MGVDRLGERGLLVRVLTLHHGLYGGYWKSTRRILLGSLVDVQWRARLPEHTGLWTLEQVAAPPLHVTDDPERLAALVCALDLIRLGAAERDEGCGLFDPLWSFYTALTRASDVGLDWWCAYDLFERSLLTSLGFGLDLSVCAVSGTTQELRWISPRSGRAVSVLAGQAVAPYADRLLPLPAHWQNHPFPSGDSLFSAQQVAQGLQITGHFLMRALAVRGLPPSRGVLLAYLRERI